MSGWLGNGRALSIICSIAVISTSPTSTAPEQSAVVLAHQDLLVDAGLVVLENIAVAARVRPWASPMSRRRR